MFGFKRKCHCGCLPERFQWTRGLHWKSPAFREKQHTIIPTTSLVASRSLTKGCRRGASLRHFTATSSSSSAGSLNSRVPQTPHHSPQNPLYLPPLYPSRNKLIPDAMDRDTDFIPSSPSISSPSSSDLDTESTGSFFHDRSTTLGTLMGVSFPEIAVRPARVPSRREHGHVGGIAGGGGGGGDGAGRRAKQRGPPERRRRRHRGGRRWWRLCRDDMVRPTSLGEFLQVERRLGGAGGSGGEVADGHFLYGSGGGGGGGVPEHEAVGGGPLFEDGRVLPPADGRRRPQQQRRASDGAVSLGRLPVLLTGICSGGEG